MLDKESGLRQFVAYSHRLHTYVGLYIHKFNLTQLLAEEASTANIPSPISDLIAAYAFEGDYEYPHRYFLASTFPSRDSDGDTA